MRKLIFSMAAAAVALSAAPAFAQDYGHDYGRGADRSQDRGAFDRSYERGTADAGRQIWMLQTQVQRNVDRGQLSRREANYFLAQIANLRDLNGRFTRHGYNARENQVISQRVQALSEQIRRASNDRGRGNDWGRGNDYRNR